MGRGGHGVVVRFRGWRCADRRPRWWCAHRLRTGSSTTQIHAKSTDSAATRKCVAAPAGRRPPRLQNTSGRWQCPPAALAPRTGATCGTVLEYPAPPRPELRAGRALPLYLPTYDVLYALHLRLGGLTRVSPRPLPFPGGAAALRASSSSSSSHGRKASVRSGKGSDGEASGRHAMLPPSLASLWRDPRSELQRAAVATCTTPGTTTYRI